ncbi:MAG TPA: hypothetical protein VEK07_22860 [Polyangiaceae bacterium]|nr:hypothetical protein [Polyangiaceae bacterium]
MQTHHTRRRPLWSALGSASATIAAIVLAIGCSTPTTETQVWQSPSYAAGPMRNIAVFGGRVDETARRTLEDAFVSALAAYGVHATPSYAVFPQSRVPNDQSAIRATLEQEGYDGALVATLEGVTEQVLIQPGVAWAGGFYGAYWGPGAPVYAQTDRYVKFETSLWSPESGNMVWSAITQTANPSSGQDFVSSLTGTVVPSLAKRGLIPPKQGEHISLVR